MGQVFRGSNLVNNVGKAQQPASGTMMFTASGQAFSATCRLQLQKVSENSRTSVIFGLFWDILGQLQDQYSRRHVHDHIFSLL
jgi:hypothetical protein